MAKISKFPRCHKRVICAVRFAYLSQGSEETLRCGAAEVEAYREGCFRAALAEFGSIQDQLAFDLADIGSPSAPVKVHASGRLLPLVFQELRNHEIHLAGSSFSKSEKPALLWWKGEPEPTDVTVWSLDVSPASFMTLDNVKKYWDPSDANKTIQWFLKTQADWGVQELFIVALEDYISFLAGQYGL
ncbi:hypothetical protein [Hyphococcus sp.]|uniref:hypothetical protein n=1 Tax=Hyphococcus sp. TaxID=2038636 RepID=UPI0035C77767